MFTDYSIIAYSMVNSTIIHEAYMQNAMAKFLFSGSATLPDPAILELHILNDSNTTTLEFTTIVFHVDSGAGVAVEGQHMQKGNLFITPVYIYVVN